MLQTEIRQARLDHGYSQRQLAELAGVPRERVRQLESGGNVTIETLEKILAALPNLKAITLGSVQLYPGGMNAAQVRDALATWLEAGRRLLTLLENVSLTPPPGAAGATRVQPAVQLTPELELRLRRLEARMGPGEVPEDEV